MGLKYSFNVRHHSWACVEKQLNGQAKVAYWHFSRFLVMPLVWSCDNILESCFIQISSYSRAYVRIMYEMGPPLRKQNIQAKELYSLT